MAAEALLALFAHRGRKASADVFDEADKAWIGALLLNEAIGHLRKISNAEIRAVIVNVEGSGDGG